MGSEGRERDVRTIGGDESGLEAVDEIIDELLAGVGSGAVDHFGALVANWTDLSGTRWSGTRPVSLVRRRLTVEVADGLTASRLRFDVPRLLVELGASLDPGAVSEIRLSVAP